MSIDAPMADDDWPQIEADARAREIADLMAAPVKPRPAIIVVGDDAVFGFTPARVC